MNTTDPVPEQDVHSSETHRPDTSHSEENEEEMENICKEVSERKNGHQTRVEDHERDAQGNAQKDARESDGEKEVKQDGASDTTECPDEPAVAGMENKSPSSSAEEMECGICYQHYCATERRPKLLSCQHSVCERCLHRMLTQQTDPGVDGGSFVGGFWAGGITSLSCPFCRQPTPLGPFLESTLPDNTQLLSRLTHCSRNAHTHPEAIDDTLTTTGDSDEVVLSPNGLAAFYNQNTLNAALEPNVQFTPNTACFVITIMEVQHGDNSNASLGRRNTDRLSTSQSSSLSSLPSLNSIGWSRGGGQEDLEHSFQLGQGCVCVCVRRLLSFLSFCSLPLGVCLLLLQRHILGLACMCVLPATLTLFLLYGCCKCMIQGVHR